MVSNPVTLDLTAIAARKPRAGPLVEPDEAIAIALSILRWTPGNLHSPDDRAVQFILKALKDAGWKIEPI
jgi:hypothetical protein